MTKQTMDGEDDEHEAFTALTPPRADGAETADGAEAAWGASSPTRGSPGSRSLARRQSRAPEAVAAAEAQKRALAEAQRKLAESAGQMLFTLIQDGGARVKQIIM